MAKPAQRLKRPPHLEALAGLSRAKVDYLLIGVLAINHYAKDPGSIYSTLDCDVLLRPDPSHVSRALRVLGGLGYSFKSGREPLLPDPLTVSRLVQNRAMIRAEKEGSLPLDLVLEARGFSFEDFYRRRRMFKAAGVGIPVGNLAQLLRSKELSGRPKDRAFLRLYRSRLST